MQRVFCMLCALVFACQSFAQQGFSVFLYNDSYTLAVSIPNDCDDGAPLPDGTPIEIRWDQNDNGVYDEGVDPLAPLCNLPPNCPGGPAGTVNYNTFMLNGISQGMGAGYFACENNFTSVGTIFPARFYLVIRCPEYSVRYVSAPLVFSPGPQEVAVLEWQGFPCSGIDPPCAPSPDVTVLAEGFNQFLISNCFHLCPGHLTMVHICSLNGGPLDPNLTPLSFWNSGCNQPNDSNCYYPDCPVAEAVVLDPTYDTDTGCWDYIIMLAPDSARGRICFTFDRFLEATATPYPQGDVIKEYALHTNYPNPFNPATTISFSLPKPGEVSLKVYDVTGREVQTLAEQRYEAGEHAVTFDGSALPSGIYFAQMTAGTETQTRKMVLLK